MKQLVLRLTVVLFVPALLAAAAPGEESDKTDDPNAVINRNLLQGLKYRSIGPARGGRSTAVTGVPGQPHVFYMGTTGGGVWKTEDAGQSWQSVSDGSFEAGSIGAVAVADSDPNVVYAGTGSACPRGNVSAGVGVYKSTDAGKTWQHVGLRQAGQIGKIRIHPSDPDLVYVSALGHIFGPNEERGVFRSRDGGKTWENVLAVSDRTGAVDLSIDVSNPRILYAAMWTAERKPWTLISGSEEGGIYRSRDGGDSWEKLSGGLPEGVVGKGAVSISPARPDRVWVLIEHADKGGVYRSDDGGESWSRVNKNRNLQQRAWYYTHIYADPVDENTVYALNTGFYKSIDGGKTFQSIRVRHGDCHDLWVNPKDTRILIQANDGGAHVSLNGGGTWSTLNNQPTSEIYRVTVDNQFPYRIYGAQQDNSTISIPSRNLGGVTPYQNWYSVGGCESGHIAVDPRDPNIIYSGCYGGSIDRTNLKTRENRNVLVYPQLQLGQAPSTLKYRFQWNAPIRLSPHDPDVVYHTSQMVHMSSDQGHSWKTISPDLTRNDKPKQDFAGEPITRDNTGVEVYGTVFAFEESPHRAGLMWAGSDDGLVHISRNGGRQWTNITPPDLPEWGTVNMIDLSAHDPGRAFIAVHRYRHDDFKPYIFRTTDYGQGWDLLTDGKNGIPEGHFVRAIREDPVRKGLLYAGTEFGLYASFDDGAHWQSLQLNLPVTPVTDLAVHRNDLVVATQGRSFWVLDDLTVLHQMGPDTDPAAAHLFRPRESVRARFGGGRGPGLRQGLPSGALIHYYLPSQPPEGEEVKLEILDDQGKTLMTFSSKAREEAEEEGSFGAGGSPRLPAEKGVNRFAWNLRLKGVDRVRDAIVWGSTGGPTALPGEYQARLQVGDWSRTAGFTVVKDPRSSATRADLEQQFEMLIGIRTELDSLYDEVRRIRSVKEQIEGLASRMAESGYGDEARESAREISRKLSEVEARLMQVKNESRQDPLNFPPMLDNQLAYLYGYVGDGDARPTLGARERFEDLKKEHAQLSSRLERIIDGEVAEFSKMIEKKKVPLVLVPGKNR